MSNFYIMAIKGDGPIRADERSAYQNRRDAERSIEKLCRENPKSKYILLKREGLFWLDPKPRVLNDRVEECAEEKL